MIQLIFAMIIWGTLGVFALWSGLSAFELAFYRCVIGSVVLGVYCWQKNYFRHVSLNRSNILYSLASGVFIILNWILLFKSFQLASITIGNVSYYLQPVFLVILGIMFFQESVKGKQWLYIILTATGVMLTSSPGAGAAEYSPDMLAGIGCAIGAGLLYAFATILVKYIDDMPPALITFIQLSVGCVLLIPLVTISDIQHANTWTVCNILIIGIVHTAAAYMLYYQAVNKVSLTLVAVLSYIDPIVAIFTDVLFFNRTLNGLQTLGILLTFIGSYQVIRLKKPQAARNDVNAVQY